MPLKFGPNGIEYESSFTTTTIDVVDNIDSGVTINGKRFLLNINNNDGTTIDTEFSIKINNNKINSNDIIVYTILSNVDNLDISIFNVSNGSCTIKFTPNGTVNDDVNVMFLVLT